MKSLNLTPGKGRRLSAARKIKYPHGANWNQTPVSYHLSKITCECMRAPQCHRSRSFPLPVGDCIAFVSVSVITKPKQNRRDSFCFVDASCSRTKTEIAWGISGMTKQQEPSEGFCHAHGGVSCFQHLSFLCCHHCSFMVDPLFYYKGTPRSVWQSFWHEGVIFDYDRLWFGFGYRGNHNTNFINNKESMFV